MELLFDYTTTPPQQPQECLRLADHLACLQGYVGHELPNQLVAIQAFARLLEEQADRLGDDARLLLGRLANLTRRADQVARRLAEMGRLLREPPWGPPLSLGDVAREVVAEARAERAALGQPGPADYHVGEALPRVRPARRLLHRVLLELVRNAAAQGAGRVEVSGAPASGGGWQISVRDDGRGFPAEGAAGLFEPFAAGRRPGALGPGLGLWLARQAVALWRGRLLVYWEVGRGATVTLSVPAGPPSPGKDEG